MVSLSHEQLNQSFKARFKLVIAFALLLAAIELVNLLTGRFLTHLGLHPRSISGLIGIITAPLLHGSLGHFLSNFMPLLVLGFFLSIHGTRKLITASIIIVILGGGLVWLFGRSSNHIGASGLVFGWWAFLLALGYYQRDWRAILTAVAVFVFYGGLLFSLFSFRSHISFEMHFFGAFAGVVAAAYLAKNK